MGKGGKLMVQRQRGKWIWHLARNWIVDEAFSIIHIEKALEPSEDVTIHLIKNVRGEWHYIRITSVDYVQPESVERDIAESAKTMLKQKSQLNLQPVRALYLYVFRDTPSDEVKNRINNDPIRQTKQMQSYFGWVDLEQGTYKLNTDSLPVKLDPLVDAIHSDEEALIEISDIQNEIDRVQEQREKHRKAWFGQSKPVWTYVLLAVNTVMFLLLSLYGSKSGEYGFIEGSSNIETLIQFGAKSAYHIIQGEWWRLATPVFLHIGVMHFVFNSIALIALGTLVEGVYGSKRFIPIYLLAGITGNVASFLFSDAPGAGASGAIFGAMGAMIYFVLNNKSAWTKAIGRDVIVLLGINIVIGFIHPSIDNYAHFGGLLGGFLVAAILGLPQKRWKPLPGLTAAIMLTTLLAGGYSYGVAEGQESVAYMKYELQQAVQKGDLQAAETILERMVRKEPDRPKIQFQLGIVYLQKEKWQDSAEAFKRVTILDPDYADAFYYLGVIAYIQGNMDEATRQLQHVLQLNSDHIEAKELLAKIKS
jgi:rhomboid protease GluP